MPYLRTIRHAPPSIWERVREAIRSYSLAPLTSSDRQIADLLGDRKPSTAGVDVTHSTAMSIPAVHRAVNAIAGDVGSLPLSVFRAVGGGKERDVNHPLHALLADAPNPEMTASSFREALQAQALLFGNGYAEVERDQAARPIAIWPFLPGQVQPFRDEALQLKYRVFSAGDRQVVLDPANVLHLRGLALDGVVGADVVHQAREAFGLAIATERFGAAFFGNGTTFGGALKHPKTLSDKAQQSLRASIESRHQGPERAHRLLILEENMDFVRFGVNPNDAQFLETREFSVREIARLFGVPPSRLSDAANLSYATSSEESLSYFVSTIRPWLIRWERELQMKLLTPAERMTLSIEHSVEGFLRADATTRAGFYETMTKAGVMTINECRRLENLPPIEGGDAPSPTRPKE